MFCCGASCIIHCKTTILIVVLHLGSEYMILKAIGENIQHLRKKKGMTQEQLAELVSLSPNHLSAIERGVYQLKFDKLAEIINCLECTPNDIFAGTYTSSYKTKASRFVNVNNR